MRDIERTLFSKGTEGAGKGTEGAGKGTEGAGGGSGGSKAEGEGAASRAGSLPAVLSSSAASEANEPPSDWNP